MGLKMLVVGLVVVSCVLWLVAGVAAEGELLRTGSSGGSTLSALLALAVTLVTIWRVAVLPLKRESSRPVSGPARTVSDVV